MTGLYTQELIDHHRAPAHYGVPSCYDCSLTEKNPLCGDEITLYLRFGPKELISWAGFSGPCCAVSKASASIMVSILEGTTTQTASELVSLAASLRRQESICHQPPHAQPLVAFWDSIRAYPVRHKCAEFPWKLLEKALEQQTQTAKR